MRSQNNRNVQAKCFRHDVRPTSAAKRCDAREESGTQQVRAFPPHEAETQAPCGCAEKLRRGVGRRSECSFRCGNCGYAHVASQPVHGMRFRAVYVAGNGSTRQVEAPPPQLELLCVVFAQSLRWAFFYTTGKSTTGTRN